MWEKERNPYKILVRKLKRRGSLGDGGAHGRNILKWILEKWNMSVWAGVI